MRKIVLAAVAAVTLLAAHAYAQSIDRGPVPAGAKVEWTMPANVSTVADATSFEVRFARSGVPLTAFTAHTCTINTTTGLVDCQAQLTQSNVDALNLVGVHQLTVRLFRADVGEGPVSAPFVLTSPAGAPTGLRLAR